MLIRNIPYIGCKTRSLISNIGSTLFRLSHGMSVSKVPKIIFVLGGPGSGKGTQCPMIQNDLGFKHISAGDLLRHERSKSNSELGELIDNHIKNGSIVPVEITCELLEKAMFSSEEDTFLIDGFPRNDNNLKGWLKLLSNKTELLFVLVLNCPTDLCLNRCLVRGDGANSRADDNILTIKKRIIVYKEETMPVIQYFQEKGMVRGVDSSQSPEEVHEAIKRIINDEMNARSGNPLTKNTE